MLSKKYTLDDEPLLQKKVRTKKVKGTRSEPKIEPEVYKILKETREARLQHNKPIPYGQLNEEDDDEDEDFIETTKGIPLEPAETEKIKGGSMLQKTDNMTFKQNNISNFHPVIHEKYNEQFVQGLKGENEELKKHINDLKQIHRYNHSLNSINHYSHQMKIRLGEF